MGGVIEGEVRKVPSSSPLPLRRAKPIAVEDANAVTESRMLFKTLIFTRPLLGGSVGMPLGPVTVRSISDMCGYEEPEGENEMQVKNKEVKGTLLFS